MVRSTLVLSVVALALGVIFTSNDGADALKLTYHSAKSHVRDDDDGDKTASLVSDHDHDPHHSRSHSSKSSHRGKGKHHDLKAKYDKLSEDEIDAAIHEVDRHNNSHGHLKGKSYKDALKYRAKEAADDLNVVKKAKTAYEKHAQRVTLQREHAQSLSYGGKMPYIYDKLGRAPGIIALAVILFLIWILIWNVCGGTLEICPGFSMRDIWCCCGNDATVVSSGSP